MKKFKLTIVIPAYNEEGNIVNLLSSIFRQRKNNFELMEILVYSDSSSDNTEKVVREFVKKHRISNVFLKKSKTRHGKWFQVNRSFREFKGDILILLDADIGLVGDNCIENLVKVFFKDKNAQMVTAHQVPLRADNFTGKVIYSSFLLWDYIRLEVPYQDHVQNLYGAAVAFRGEFVKKINIPYKLGNSRCYLYLKAKSVNGFRYCKKSAIVYWPVTTLGDFIDLSHRSFGVKHSEMEKMFNVKMGEVYSIGRKYKIAGLIKSFKNQPVYTPLALMLNLYIGKLRPKTKIKHTALWKISLSSKKPIKT